MKIRQLFAIVGLAFTFTAPVFAQQKDAVDPEKRAAMVAFEKPEMEAWNTNDAHALAATFTDDAVLVTDRGLVYGREAIEKYYSDLFQKMHFSEYLITPDQYSPHAIGTAGNEDWATGEWSLTVKGQTFGPIEVKGFWSAIHVREGDVWKNLMVVGNTTPKKAATPSPTASPSNQ
jgi:ketosteroid isomerase-like protein